MRYILSYYTSLKIHYNCYQVLEIQFMEINIKNFAYVKQNKKILFLCHQLQYTLLSSWKLANCKYHWKDSYKSPSTVKPMSAFNTS